MNASEIVRQLRVSGHIYGDCYMNSKGQLCLIIDDVAMFQFDAEDLLRGRATPKEIIERNKGENLGWTAAG